MKGITLREREEIIELANYLTLKRYGVPLEEWTPTDDESDDLKGLLRLIEWEYPND